MSSRRRRRSLRRPWRVQKRCAGGWHRGALALGTITRGFGPGEGSLGCFLALRRPLSADLPAWRCMHAVPQDLNKAVAEHEALRQVQGAAESESSGVAEAAPGQTEAQVSLEIANVEAQAAAELLAGAQQWAVGLAEALSVSQVRSFACVRGP